MPARGRRKRPPRHVLPGDVVDEVQLISLDSIKLEKDGAGGEAAPNAREAALGEAYLTDRRFG